MKIVVLTNDGSLYGRRLLTALSVAGIQVTTVVIKQSPTYYFRLFRMVRREIGYMGTVAQFVQRLLARRWENNYLQRNQPESLRAYSDMCEMVVETHGTNTESTIQSLNRLRPDILILGQTGIVRNSILTVPRIGTLNAHPGMLPMYRGLDCYKWALFEGRPDCVGASVHWVDEGVDTGPVISSKRVDIRGFANFREVEFELYKECINMLCFVLKGMENAPPTRGEMQKKEDGCQYRKMPLWKERYVRRNLRSLSSID